MEARKHTIAELRPFQLSLRVRHPSMDPAELSREFKLKAEHSYRAGDARAPRSGSATASLHTESYWLASLDPDKLVPPDISFPGHPKLQLAAEHLRVTAANSFGWALSLSASGFLNQHAGLLRRIRSDGGQVSLLVTLSAGDVSTFSLAPEVSRIFAECGVTVEFDLADA